jgi:ribosomal protein S24E
MTDYQKAEVERQKRDEALKLKTPIKIGEGVSGAPIMALPRLNPQTNQVDLYPIGRDGTISAEPVAPGSSIRPQATPSQAGPTPQRDPTAPVGSPQSRNQQFIGQVAQEDPAYAASIKKAADYELDPAKYASMRTNQRQKFINDVIQYDPNYNPQQVGLKYRAQAAFLPGTKNGDTITAFNTAISHLDVLKQLYRALNNGDVQSINRIKNTFQQEFGYAAPNDVSALSSIIGGEVVKATVGAQNALGDRDEVRESIKRDLGSQQADSVIDKYQKLMAGQLNARKFAYEQSTGLHNFEDKFLLPRSQQVLHSVAGEGGSGAPAAPPPLRGNKPASVIQNGHTYNLQPDGSYK